MSADRNNQHAIDAEGAMLSREDNELLVRTGPGTAAGALFRRFWTPVLLAAELDGRDRARVDVLGERLVAVRDADDTIVLVEASPRRATGRSVVYPARERGGLIWAYLGPADTPPPFPAIELFDHGAPADRRHFTKIIMKGNWLQQMEGDVDSSHVSFLHSRLDGAPLPGSRVDASAFVDRSPRWFPSETPYGLMLAAQRDFGASAFHWRVNQFLLPYMTLIASPPGVPLQANVRVPIDDETTLFFRCYYHPDRALSAEERATFANGVLVPELLPGTFDMVESIENDYLIDREAQRTQTFTGIRSIPAQDLACTQDQGGGWIADRSRELLVSSDRAIILLRKRFLTLVKALQDGVEPAEPNDAAAYRVRPAAFSLDRDVPLSAAVVESRALAAVR